MYMSRRSCTNCVCQLLPYKWVH